MRTLRRRIDLNADLGESPERWASGEDQEILKQLTSANVCCGAYAGNPALIAATCGMAKDLEVTIGAQVGYPDRDGFGRRSLDISPSALYKTVRDQINFLHDAASHWFAIVEYVKPHGALYNDLVHDEARARAVMEGALDAGLEIVLGLPGSVSLRVANELGLTTVHEGFADRAYLDDGTLMPRSEPGAVLSDPDDVAAQAVRLLTTDIDTICIHSDSPGAVDAARATRQALEQSGVTLAPFYVTVYDEL